MAGAHVSSGGKSGQPRVAVRAQLAGEHEANGDAKASAAKTLRAADDHDDTAGRTADADPRQLTDVAPPPAPALLHADVIPPPAPLPAVAPVPVRARLLAAFRALLREAPAAFAVAAAYRSVADDGDLGLAAWVRLGCLYPKLLVARAAAVRGANTLAGAHRLRTDVAPPPARLLHSVAHLPARACLLALLREAPAVFAVAAAYGYRDVAADGDLGLAAWVRLGCLFPALLVARTAAVRAAAVLAGHPLAGAHGLRRSHAVRDILVVILALAAALAAIHFP